MFAELTITAESAKAGHVRIEYFETLEAGEARRTHLKNTETFGTSNTYRLVEVEQQVPAAQRHYRTY